MASVKPSSEKKRTPEKTQASEKKTSSEKTTTALVKTPTRELVKSKMTTCIQVKYDAGFGNFLSIRGEGANLSWDKGIALKNINGDEWLFETNLDFKRVEFKILINDLQFESGNNHFVDYGNYLQFHPTF